jgi:hypothetical protein
MVIFWDLLHIEPRVPREMSKSNSPLGSAQSGDHKARRRIGKRDDEVISGSPNLREETKVIQNPPFSLNGPIDVRGVL